MSTEIDDVEISLDAYSIQPGTIFPSHKSYFAYIFHLFSFLSFVFLTLCFILILLHTIETLYCLSTGVRAFAFLYKKKYQKIFFSFSFVCFVLIWGVYTILTSLTPCDLVLGCI